MLLSSTKCIFQHLTDLRRLREGRVHVITLHVDLENKDYFLECTIFKHQFFHPEIFKSPSIHCLTVTAVDFGSVVCWFWQSCFTTLNTNYHSSISMTQCAFLLTLVQIYTVKQLINNYLKKQQIRQPKSIPQTRFSCKL